MLRRSLLKSVATLALSTAAEPALQAFASSASDAASFRPIIDGHIHLFDPTRPGGVPWPEPSDAVLYRSSLPPRYMQLAQPHGIVGAIAIECSSWLVDNFWLQDVVERNTIMVGFIGDLTPEAPDFAATLDRLHRSPLFLGIRYGNLWDRDLGAAAQNPKFISGLKLLAQAGLVLESANPDPALIAALVLISDRVPELRIVIDHLPHADAPTDAKAKASYESNLRELSRRPNIFVKGSEIVRRIDSKVSLDAASYKNELDQIWELFGEDRVLFGSDWPNSDSLADFDDTLGVAEHYIATRRAAAQEKYFWKNSVSAYAWRPRNSAQQRLGRK